MHIKSINIFAEKKCEVLFAVQKHLFFFQQKWQCFFLFMENVISHSPGTSLVLNNGKESEKYKNVTISINMAWLLTVC